MSSGTYSSGFVASVIVNGKMQHIAKDNSITIPFESEYSIRLQNKNARRAVAKIFIDDENVSDAGFVINAYSQIEVERSINNQFKFKFVSLTSGQAANAGKSKNYDGEKGVIRVEFSFEKKVALPQWTPRSNPYHPFRKDLIPPTWNNRDDYPVSYGDCKGLSETYCSSALEADEKTSGGIGIPTTRGEAGATVYGDHSNQSFCDVYMDVEDSPAVVITLLLRGWSQETLPTINSNCLYCSNCGLKASKKSDKYCSRCGSKLG